MLLLLYHQTIQTLCGSMFQDVDKATSARIALETQLENLEVELAFLQRVHKEVIYILLSIHCILQYV